MPPLIPTPVPPAASASSFSSPVRLRTTVPIPADIPDELRKHLAAINLSLQLAEKAFTSNAGASSPAAGDWPKLTGSPSTILASNMGRLIVTAAQTLSYGQMINLFTNGDALGARLASASDPSTHCDGFCNVASGIMVGTSGEIILSSGTVNISGLTPGQQYYLSQTPGAIQGSPVVTAGTINQYLGKAIDKTTLYFDRQKWVVN